MAKEQEEDGTSLQSVQEADPVMALTEHLRAMARNRTMVKLACGQEFTLCGEVKDVRVQPVWAYFTVGQIGFRTSSKGDKEALLRGETLVCLTKVFDRSAKTKLVEARRPFIQRSRWSLLYGADIVKPD